MYCGLNQRKKTKSKVELRKRRKSSGQIRDRIINRVVAVRHDSQDIHLV